MHPLGIRLARHWRLEAWLVMSVLTIAVLLFAFGLIAQEVTEGKPLAFDQNVMRALRNSANPSVPIGPSLVTRSGARHNESGQHHCARTHNICGGGILVFGSQVRGGLADARRRARRGRAEHPPQVRVRTPSSRFRNPCCAGLYHELSQRTCHIIGHYLSDNRSPSSANPPLTHNTPLFDVTRGVSDRAHRPEPNLPRRSLSDRCSRRLVHWRGLGHGLLGAVGVAAEWRSGRTIQPVVTAAKAAVRCSMYFGLLSARSRCHAIIESA